MRIGVVAPPWYEVPPRSYGGIELLVSWLVEGLVERGHEVTLIAAGRNATPARFVQTYESAPSARVGEALPELIQAAASQRALDGLELDVVHDHTLAGPLLACTRTIPTVVTAHGPVCGDWGSYLRHVGEAVSLVAISDAQRLAAPLLPWFGRVHNGIPVADYIFRDRKEGSLLFLGRMSPEKGAHIAIDAAREAGYPIVIAAKCTEPREHAYFENQVRPRLGRDTVWVGEADAAYKKELLAHARALVFPIRWEEPFGLVLVEAMASGTPVVALRGGAVSEIVEDGVTGFVCRDPAQLPDALRSVERIDPRACRRRAAARFDASRMVAEYEAVYRRAIVRKAAAASDAA